MQLKLSSFFTFLNDAKGNHVTTPEAMTLPEVLITAIISIDNLFAQLPNQHAPYVMYNFL